MTSTVPAFKTALASRLRAALSCAVYYGDPAPDKMADRAVMIGGAKREPLEWVCGMSQANEVYDLDVAVSILGPEQETHETLLALAYGINADIVTSVLGWGSLPAGVNQVIPAASEDFEDVDGGWREAGVVQTFHVIARI